MISVNDQNRPQDIELPLQIRFFTSEHTGSVPRVKIECKSRGRDSRNSCATKFVQQIRALNTRTAVVRTQFENGGRREGMRKRSTQDLRAAVDPIRGIE